MKRTMMRTGMKTMAMTVLVCLGLAANAMPTKAMPVKKSQDPWRTMMAVMSQLGMDTNGVSVATEVDKSMRFALLDAYKQAMKVKEYVALDPGVALGEYVSATVKVKYAKKKGEEWDYRKVQYGIDQWEMRDFLERYPQSEHADEIRAKAECLQQYKEWKLYGTFGSGVTKMARDYPDNTVCPYEGYVPLARVQNAWRADWREWQRIAQGSGLEDYAVYEEYLGSRPGLPDGLKSMAKDSVKICHERYDYRTAMESPTIHSLTLFLTHHPGSEKEPYVRSLLAEKEAWEEAVNGGTHGDYLNYLQRYPLGDNALLAKERMRQIEEPDWALAEKRNTEASYTTFLDKWPEGYYAEMAESRQVERALAKMNVRESDMQKVFHLVGPSSRQGYSKIRIGNLDKNLTMTVSITGGSNLLTLKLKPGQTETRTVPNGLYSIYMLWSGNVDMKDFNSKGKLKVEDGLYHTAWYTYTPELCRYLSDEEIERRYADPTAMQRYVSGIVTMVNTDLDALKEQDVATKRAVLRNYYRRIETEEEYRKIYRELNDDSYVDIFLILLYL